MARHEFVRLGLVGLIVGLFVACGDAGERLSADGRAEEPQRAAPLDPALAQNLPPGVPVELAQQGAQLFPQTCVACHGPDGSGTAIGPNLRSAEWKHVPADLDQVVELIRTGVPNPNDHPIPMPALGGGNYDDEQLRALAAYVLALRGTSP